MIVMGILIGLAVAFLFYLIHRWLPTTSGIDIILTLVTPYCMYYAAEHFHYSGVLAVVSGGLLLSNRRQRLLTYRSRLEGVNVWTNLVFVMNGLIFLLIGLELPVIRQGLGDIGLRTAITYGLIISLVLIVTRLLCTFGAVLFTKAASRFITVADNNPGWKGPLVLGWAGMRGVVSLAAALSVPLLINGTQPFPYRSLILFITFIVILVTLVFQGFTLPWVIRKVKMSDKFRTITEREQELIIQKKLAKASLHYLEERHGAEKGQNDHLDNLLARLQLDLNFFQQDFEAFSDTNENSLSAFQRIYLELLEQQRTLLNDMNRRTEFDEELIRKYMGLIDLEEFKMREKLFEDINAK